MRARWVPLPLLILLLGCPGPGPTSDLAAPADLASSPADLSSARDLTLPARSCTSEQACQGPAESCYAPGEPRPCGACRRPDPNEACSTDAQCKARGATLICVTGVAACTCNGEGVCATGCTAPGDCVDGEVCGAGNRCQGRPCQGDGDCPAAMRCNASRCERRSCAASAACPGGYCVKGACYDQPGQCEPPRP